VKLHFWVASTSTSTAPQFLSTSGNFCGLGVQYVRPLPSVRMDCPRSSTFSPHVGVVCLARKP
jgi:hypothetical protein